MARMRPELACRPRRRPRRSAPHCRSPVEGGRSAPPPSCAEHSAASGRVHGARGCRGPSRPQETHRFPRAPRSTPRRISRTDRIVVVLAWMELEMTGLDPARHVIVEIATLITDDELAVVAEGPDLVVQASGDELARWTHHVRVMHTRSGLLEAINASPISSRRPAGRPSSSSGSTSRGPDRAPLRQLHRTRPALPLDAAPRDRGLPPLRSIDVSSIKELCRAGTGDPGRGFPPRSRRTVPSTTSGSRSPSWPTTLHHLRSMTSSPSGHRRAAG